ncbi:hypothetical protein WN944_006157 [Citrus x changshan-huyou]|uniref:O-methyltransferase C-terminal domain-containing protein n=1 Tax=Citrus x changshan-huyou TaxID=2935761 RepID=A0AAP0QTJ8_9ROSI
MWNEQTTYGKNFWDFVVDEPNLKSIFCEAMIADSELITSIVVEDCKAVFKGLKSLVDVGGGTGTMARAIATAFPDIKCIVLICLLWWIIWWGTNNLEFFLEFEAIPPANVVLLKIIDMAIENQTKGKETMETQLCFDLLMATFLNGKEGSVYDWKKLFLAAGFSHYKITPNLGLWSLIEAYP